MNIAISDFEHHQYIKTLTDLFDVGGFQISVFTTTEIEAKLKAEYGLTSNSKLQFFVKSDELFTAYIERVNTVGKHLSEFDLFFINPIYPFSKDDGTIRHHYQFTKSIPSKKKLLSIFNLNNWYKPKIRRPGQVFDFMYRQLILKSADYLILIPEMEEYARKSFRISKPIINIPFTYHIPSKRNSVLTRRESERINIVIPGEVNLDRRDYLLVLDALENHVAEPGKIRLYFLGVLSGGNNGFEDIIKRVNRLNTKYEREIITTFDNRVPALEFDQYMAEADVIISPLKRSIVMYGTMEYYGQSKSSGATFDMITYSLPLITPDYINTDSDFSSAILKYTGAENLGRIINRLNSDKEYLLHLKKEALEASENCTLEKWRKKIFSSLNIPLS